MNVGLVAQPHGGAIKQGGNPGNQGGKGAVPSEVRQIATQAFADALPGLLSLYLLLTNTLDQFSTTVKDGDGNEVQVIDFDKATPAMVREIRGCLDLLGRYGIGSQVSVTIGRLEWVRLCIDALRRAMQERSELDDSTIGEIAARANDLMMEALG